MQQVEYKTFTQLRKLAGLKLHEVSELTGYSPRTVYRWEEGVAVPKKIVIDKMFDFCIEKIDKFSPENHTFTFIDLFAGIGGMRTGFERAGGKCIYTCEWNKYSLETYRANFSCDHPIGNDINYVLSKDIPNHDILLAGFPCQPFSIAGVSKKKSLGKKHGFEDESQGNLFFEIKRILDAKKPNAFLLENVKNLKNHDKGNTYKVIMKNLEKDYYVFSEIIDAQHYVPQHRERIFLVGFRKDRYPNIDFKFPKKPDHQPKIANILLNQVDKKYTLSDKLWDYLQNYAAKHKKKGNGFGFGLVDPKKQNITRTLSARYYKDGSEILIKQYGKNPRRLTPKECASLMGFDDKFKIVVSDTQAYKQFGNAVAVPVVEAVAREITKYI